MPSQKDRGGAARVVALRDRRPRASPATSSAWSPRRDPGELRGLFWTSGMLLVPLVAGAILLVAVIQSALRRPFWRMRRVAGFVALAALMASGALFTTYPSSHDGRPRSRGVPRPARRPGDRRLGRGEAVDERARHGPLAAVGLRPARHEGRPDSQGRRPQEHRLLRLRPPRPRPRWRGRSWRPSTATPTCAPGELGGGTTPAGNHVVRRCRPRRVPFHLPPPARVGQRDARRTRRRGPGGGQGRQLGEHERASYAHPPSGHQRPGVRRGHPARIPPLHHRRPPASTKASRPAASHPAGRSPARSSRTPGRRPEPCQRHQRLPKVPNRDDDPSRRPPRSPPARPRPRDHRRRPLADGALGHVHARRDRGHPDQGRAGPLPDPRVRHPPAADLGHLRRPDVRPRHPDAHPAGGLSREVLARRPCWAPGSPRSRSSWTSR